MMLVTKEVDMLILMVTMVEEMEMLVTKVEKMFIR